MLAKSTIAQIKRVTILSCVLIAIPCLAHYEHEEPLPHALQSEFLDLRSEVHNVQGQIRDSNSSINARLTGIEDEILIQSEADKKLAETVEELILKTQPESDDVARMDVIAAGIGGGVIGALLATGCILLLRRRLFNTPEKKPDVAPAREQASIENSSSEQETTDDSDEDEGRNKSELRTVTASRKDERGVILAICNHDEPWQERTVEEAIVDMKKGIQYESKGPTSGARAQISYVDREGVQPHLKTVADDEDDNNLENLPPC